MAQVTIIGSTTPCVELATGEKTTCELTDHVQRLIDRGYVEVLEWIDDEPVPAPKRRGRPRKATPPADTAAASTAALSDAVSVELTSGGGADRVGGRQSDTVDVATAGPAQDRAVDTPDETPA